MGSNPGTRGTRFVVFDFQGGRIRASLQDFLYRNAEAWGRERAVSSPSAGVLH